MKDKIDESKIIRSFLCKHGHDHPELIMKSAWRQNEDKSTAEYIAAEKQLRARMHPEYADQFMRVNPSLEIIKAAIKTLPPSKEERIQRFRAEAGLTVGKRKIIHHSSQATDPVRQRLRNEAGLDNRQRKINGKR